MSPSDPAVAEHYRRAWGGLAAPELIPDAPFHLMGPRVIRNWSPSQRGRRRVRSPLPRPGIFATRSGRARSFCISFPSVTGVALSLRYRQGRVRPDDQFITFFEFSEKKPRDALGTGQIPSEIGRPAYRDVVEAGVPKLNAVAQGIARAAGSGRRCLASISHVRVTWGALGCLVEDDRRVVLVLSCAHILLMARGCRETRSSSQAPPSAAAPRRISWQN